MQTNKHALQFLVYLPCLFASSNDLHHILSFLFAVTFTRWSEQRSNGTYRSDHLDDRCKLNISIQFIKLVLHFSICQLNMPYRSLPQWQLYWMATTFNSYSSFLWPFSTLGLWPPKLIKHMLSHGKNTKILTKR